MKKIRNTMIISLIMVFFAACGDDFTVISPKEYDGKFPDESAINIDIVFSDSGRVNFHIQAPLLNKYENGDESYFDCPEGVTVVSYDDWGYKQSVLTADYAISNDTEQQMEAHRNVVVTNLQKKETIETEKIIWDKRNKKIYSDVAVKLIKEDGSVYYGEGFESDERFKKYTIWRFKADVYRSDI
ncbi:LPS export ABC transporter periplasmic protein LptC [Bacteroidales bacterium OttesenSCG-928-B11]|nr:LPS export ABC transporter periplasmic protein LptC [Bacteroidales bacterium OttesenSCG-928-C03]MDL2312496.1 LPS export ABC transporter periplasmic protein LptC [Bacteroidales bacterium OttesenSCG-928-B11]